MIEEGEDRSTLNLRQSNERRLTVPAPGSNSEKQLSISIDSIAEFAGAFKGDNFTLSEDQIRAGRRVAAAPFVLAFHTKLAESRYENVIALFEGRFHNFQQ